MSAEQLAVYAGIALSLFMSYFPGVGSWYNALENPQKLQVMGGLLAVTALVVFGLSCAGLYPLVACTVEGAEGLLSILIAALIANQATYVFAVKPIQSTSAPGQKP